MEQKIIDKLKGIIPDKVIIEIPQVMNLFKIDTVLRLSHFLSQCAHESGNFSLVQENLNYSADRLSVVFPKYFKTPAEALPYHRNPSKIANRVYANRMGNGNEQSGEGFKYKGKGYIQLTGKDNYIAFDKYVPEDIITNPDLVATKYPLLSAAWFFNKKNLNAVSDLGSSDAIITRVTLIVNGGSNGLASRIEEFHKIYNALNKTVA